MGNQAILPPWKTVARMPGDLQNELPVPAFVQEATGRRPLHWEAAKDKRAGGEAEVLPGDFALQSDALDGLDLAHSPLRYDIFGVKIRQYPGRPDPLQTSGQMY